MLVALGVLEKLGIFVVGALARIGLFLAVVAALAVPLVAVAWAINAVRGRRRRALGLHAVEGITVRPGVRYASNHVWLERRGEGAVQLGVDDLALRLLPAVTAVEAPRVGARVKRGELVATLWGGGRQLPVRAPFDARIAGVNAAVVRDPAIVRGDGYGRGWLVALEPADASWEALPSGDQADAWMAAEAHRWNGMLERQLGVAAADGGELISPAPWLVGEENWRELAAAFTAVR